MSTLSTYHLFGFRHETIELPKHEESCFKGSITLNIIANSILFDPPTGSSKNSLVSLFNKYVYQKRNIYTYI